MDPGEAALLSPFQGDPIVMHVNQGLRASLRDALTPTLAIHVPHQVRDKLQPGSSHLRDFWMPVEDPVFSGDQVRHDGQNVPS